MTDQRPRPWPIYYYDRGYQPSRCYGTMRRKDSSRYFQMVRLRRICSDTEEWHQSMLCGLCGQVPWRNPRGKSAESNSKTAAQSKTEFFGLFFVCSKYTA